jgi:MOSC domain-containing protein YiiM
MGESVGRVVEVNISPVDEQVLEPADRVAAVAGRGLRGDRNYLIEGEPQAGREEDLTLIATEALDALAAEHDVVLSAAESRRNVATSGVDLNALVGRRFRVGAVECEGIQLCEPCAHLQGLTQPGVLRGLVHRGGLRAAIVVGGDIAVGDEVRPL